MDIEIAKARVIKLEKPKQAESVETKREKTPAKKKTVNSAVKAKPVLAKHEVPGTKRMWVLLAALTGPYKTM